LQLFLHQQLRRAWTLPACAAVLALLVGGVHITDEGYVDLGGDAPRYLMNGAFFRDAARDAPIVVRDVRAYAEQYYARYPALSVGFHPVLPSLLMVPFFGLFGISVASARMVPLLCFIAASVFLLLLVQRIYNRPVAIAATLLFIFSPFAAWFSRTVMSEMSALAAVVAATYFCERYSRSERRLDLWLFIASAVLSLYGKQLAALMLPVYAVYLASQGGFRRLLKPELIVSVFVAAIVLLPLVPITLVVSAQNVRWVTAGGSANTHADSWSFAVIARAMAAQMSWPIVVVAALGTIRAVVTRDLRSVLFILWVSAFAALVVFLTGEVESNRYTIYWVPAVCTLAASTIADWSTRTARIAAVAALVLSFGWEALVASRIQLDGAGGYDEAARYVVRQTPGTASVLFSGDVDTGYFVFFVRKHDPDRRLVVLRSNKLLTTSYMTNLAFREQIQRPEEIDGILKEFGTRFVIIEDQPSKYRVLEWLRTRVKHPPFVERLRVPLRSRSPRLRNVDVVVFENVGVSPPNPDAQMRLDLPLAGLIIDVRLGDVLAGPGRR
jgi:hypothetical protein